ncbi:hypothetical protein ACFRAE_17695 [Sphingobacterium sp. HJSM2_6]|uniref:hypothetical protein n=1 Tax=Sphingobacterium sp. HJSM2_6 TaxID=3366264 RepID=UPI003BC5D6D9
MKENNNSNKNETDISNIVDSLIPRIIKLSETDYKILMMYFEGYKLYEISDYLGISIDDVNEKIKLVKMHLAC